MKSLLSLLFAFVLAPAAWAVGGPYEAGKHYEVIAEQGTAKPEVKEFFSFYCPHCYAFETRLHEVVSKLPEGTSFKKYHVDFMGQAPQAIQQNLTEVMVLAALKNKSETVNKALFRHIHDDHRRFGTAEDIKEVALAGGLDAASYDKDLQGFMIKSQVKLMQKEQNDLSKRKVLTSVPTLIVNGRYKLKMESLDTADLQADLQGLINYLLTK